jgi:hypothetical protein
MSFMLTIVTSLPTWAVLVLGFGAPALAAGIALLGHYFGYRAAGELEARSKREEVMRSLRWAAELSVSNDAAKSLLGIRQLKALRDSELLTPVEQRFIDAALNATIEIARAAITRSGEDVQVIREADANAAAETTVPSEEGKHGEGAEI